MKFKINYRWYFSREPLDVEIGAEFESQRRGVQLGAAIKVALKTRAVLTDADLTGAVLTRADLTGAVLTDADLTGAVLTDADLTGADLTGAVLTGAKWINGITINRAPIQASFPGYWTTYILDAHMQIGCELHTFGEWEGFTDREIERMSGQALDFWHTYKPALMALCRTRKE